jgi:uncharacterized protein YjbI with pentapeptide repeats
MWKPFKQLSPKIKRHDWWVIGAIATPVFLCLVGWLWLLPERRFPLEGDHLSHSAGPTFDHQYHETPSSSMRAIAIAGGIFLLLGFRMAQTSAQTLPLSRADLKNADLSGANLSHFDFNGADFSGVNLCEANLSSADLSGAELSSADLSGANLSGASFSGANLCGANLSGVNFSGANLRYANLSGANLRYANLSGADLRCANLSRADLNCTLISDANLSDANLSGALLFFINLREVLNLEPLQLEAEPSPLLCNAALPAYSQQTEVNPNRACGLIPQILSTRYDISLEEAQGIVNEARQHPWN